MSLSYHPLHLADVSVCTIVGHQGLALLVHPIPLLHDSELVGHPVAAELVSGLLVLNQPIKPPLKVLLLGQIDPMNLGGLYLLLQRLHTKKNYISCQSKKLITSTPTCKREVNSPACSRRQQICKGCA
jgi:hypothetical protein